MLKESLRQVERAEPAISRATETNHSSVLMGEPHFRSQDGCC